jgi:glycosyltransferase involved in cell wall biosynthesis
MKPGLCFVVSVPMTAVAFLNGHIDYLSSDYEITVVCNFDGTEKDISKNAQLKNIRIARMISAISDLRAVYSLARFLKKGNFQIVHSVTPKAGLITAMAGWLAKTPIRIHWFTGQVWVLKSGIQRWLLNKLDRLIAKLNTSVLVDSPSQRDFLIEQRVINPTKAHVLGSGSIAGVDTERFRPNPEVRVVTRAELGIEDPNAPIILFVGRLNHDKGIDTLLQAFSSQTIQQNSYLLLVGPDEENYTPRIPELLGERLENFRYIPFTAEPERYMASSDIFCLPSLREGFGLSVIEASACELPVIATNIYGVKDAVRDRETGILLPVTDPKQFASTISELSNNRTLMADMGLKGRIFVQENFESANLQKHLAAYYTEVTQGFRLPHAKN